MSLARTTERARLDSNAVVRVEWVDSPIGIAGAGATIALGVKTAKIKTRRRQTMIVAEVPTGAVGLPLLRVREQVRVAHDRRLRPTKPKTDAMSRKLVAVIRLSVLVVDSVVPRVKRVPNRRRDMDPLVLRRTVVRRARAIGVLKHAVKNIADPVIRVPGGDMDRNGAAHVSLHRNECTVPRRTVPKVGMRRAVLMVVATEPSTVTSDMDTGTIMA
jgi:hypothetical protein